MSTDVKSKFADSSTADDIIDEALKDVKQEILIEMDGLTYIVYVIDGVYRNGELELSLATPHDDLDEYTKEKLYSYAYDCVRVQINEGLNTECQSKNPFLRIYCTMKNIFGSLFRS